MRKAPILCCVLVFALRTLCTVQAAKSSGLVSCLQQVRGLSVEVPDTASYKKYRQVWEKKVDPAYPIVIVVPKSKRQVQEAIVCANKAGVRVVPKSGGHSYLGYSMQNMTMSIDLRTIDDIEVDSKSNTLTCGAGASLGELYYGAWYEGQKGFNAGTCPPVGVSGFFLGGGFGYYSRRAGMSCDNVVSFSMVNWKGNLVQASRKKNKDLFWAACGGGGGNFGLVVEWTIEMMDVPHVIQYASIKYPEGIDIAVDVLDYYQTWAAKSDENLGTEFHFGPKTPASSLFFYYAGQGSLSDILNESKLLTIAGGETPTVSYKNLTWINAVLNQAGWGLTDPEQLLQKNWSQFQDYRKEKSYYIYPNGWSKSLFTGLFNLWQTMYPEQGNIKFRASGGKIADVEPTATAFPHRTALGWMIFKAEWDEGDSNMEKKGYDWLAKSSQLIQSDGEPNYAYINYIDNLEDWQDAYYRFNYPKLQKVKRAYDPKDMFSYPQMGISAKKPPPCQFKPCISSS